MRWDDQHSLTAFDGIAAFFIGGVQLSRTLCYSPSWSPMGCGLTDGTIRSTQAARLHNHRL
jgi:hypothetical protein